MNSSSESTDKKWLVQMVATGEGGHQQWASINFSETGLGPPTLFDTEEEAEQIRRMIFPFNQHKTRVVEAGKQPIEAITR